MLDADGPFRAVKFTQRGQVALSCRLQAADLDEKSYQLEFCIADTGIGIKPDKLNLIFDTFAQADGSTTRVGRPVVEVRSIDR
jgi:osomolarity two-component system sensor histidine kinase NIK1